MDSRLFCGRQGKAYNLSILSLSPFFGGKGDGVKINVLCVLQLKQNRINILLTPLTILSKYYSK